MSGRLFEALKALPLIRFALMLGGGVTMTGLTAWIVFVLAHFQWPAETAAARVDALAWIALGALAIIGLVMVALAWGKADRIKVSLAGNELDLDFEGEAAGVAPAVDAAKGASQ